MMESAKGRREDPVPPNGQDDGDAPDLRARISQLQRERDEARNGVLSIHANWDRDHKQLMNQIVKLEKELLRSQPTVLMEDAITDLRNEIAAESSLLRLQQERDTLIQAVSGLIEQWRRVEEMRLTSEGLAAEQARHDCADDLEAALSVRDTTTEGKA